MEGEEPLERKRDDLGEGRNRWGGEVRESGGDEEARCSRRGDIPTETEGDHEVRSDPGEYLSPCRDEVAEAHPGGDEEEYVGSLHSGVETYRREAISLPGSGESEKGAVLLRDGGEEESTEAGRGCCRKMTVWRRKMTIVHLFTHSAITRGGAVQGMSLAQRQHDDGHRVLCIFHKPWGRAVDTRFTRSFSFPVVHLTMTDPLSYVRFARWMQLFSPEVVHCHRNLALLFGYFSLRVLGRTMRRPILLVNRGTTYELPNRLVRWIFRSDGLDHVIAVAEAVKRTLVDREQVAAEKITVIYGSYDEERFHPAVDGGEFRRAMGLSPHEPLVVSVAAVDRRKGLEYFLGAARDVRDTLSAGRFFVVGAEDDPGYGRQIRREAASLGMREVFHLLGHRDDIPTVLAAADLSVCASVEGEGLTGAIRESLAMERPVVATAVSGNPELVVDGETGWLVPSREVKALSRAIVEALTHREEAARRARRGYERVRRLCSLDERYRRVMTLYGELIAQKR